MTRPSPAGNATLMESELLDSLRPNRLKPSLLSNRHPPTPHNHSLPISWDLCGGRGATLGPTATRFLGRRRRRSVRGLDLLPKGSDDRRFAGFRIDRHQLLSLVVAAKKKPTRGQRLSADSEARRQRRDRLHLTGWKIPGPKRLPTPGRVRAYRRSAGSRAAPPELRLPSRGIPEVESSHLHSCRRSQSFLVCLRGRSRGS